jgi:hypothetical protein
MAKRKESVPEMDAPHTEMRPRRPGSGIGNFRPLGRHSGASIESPVAALIDAGSDNKATRVLTYLDPKQALEAAGLRE